MVKESLQYLPNKHRPKDFKDLVGQDHITYLIKTQLQNDSIPNCLIFYGSPGTGKTTMARIISQTLNNHECGTIEIDSAIDGGKDFITSIQQDIYNVPYVGKYKTYIFDEVHELTKKSFASLLKTLEEPPPYVKFILITNNFDKIPLNIKSRSQSHHFSLIPINLIRERLDHIAKVENKKVSQELLDLAAYSGKGSLRDSIIALDIILASLQGEATVSQIADSLGVLGTQRVSDFVYYFLIQDFINLLKSVKCFYSENIDPQKGVFELQQFIIDLRLYFINTSLGQDIKSDISFIVSKLETNLNKKLEKLSVSDRKLLGSQLDKMYEASLIIESSLYKTQNKEALFTKFVIKLAALWNG